MPIIFFVLYFFFSCTDTIRKNCRLKPDAVPSLQMQGLNDETMELNAGRNQEKGKKKSVVITLWWTIQNC